MCDRAYGIPFFLHTSGIRTTRFNYLYTSRLFFPHGFVFLRVPARVKLCCVEYTAVFLEDTHLSKCGLFFLIQQFFYHTFVLLNFLKIRNTRGVHLPPYRGHFRNSHCIKGDTVLLRAFFQLIQKRPPLW